MKKLGVLLLLLTTLVSCRYSETEGEQSGFLVDKNMNLELYTDSVLLELLPIKDTYVRLDKGMYVVVAELAIHPEDPIDSLWVKVAHSQDVQGWLRQSELAAAFIPTDSISAFIYLFSRKHTWYFIIFISHFIGFYLLRSYRKKQIHLFYIRDIDSMYPLIFCFLIAVGAVLYGSIQLFVPELWQHYFFNPTLSPFKTPPILSAFLAVLWLSVLILLAVLDDVFSQLSPSDAVFYLLGLFTASIFCYFFFILTTPFYVGYLFLLLFGILLLQKFRKANTYLYRCGSCSRKLKAKGICPHCGVLNK